MENIDRNHFELDKPITSSSEDILGYSNFSKSVAELIHNRTSSDGFVISLSAPWGYGKTSCINLVKEQLKDYNDTEIIDFNPWCMLGNQEDLFINFFLSLKPYIQKLYNLKAITKKEMKGFFNLLSGFSINLGFAKYDCKNLATTFQQSSNILEQKNEIENFLASQNKKIIVFIDDIDRLNVNEIIQIFRLVKAVANFKNITYILAYDADIVASALQQEQLIDGKKYLEKIIQLQLSLPFPQKNSLENYFLKKMNEIATDVELSDNDKEIWGNAYTEIIKKHIRNPREINRLYNALITTYPIIRNEVNFIDFVIIEFIRIFYNQIWQIISNNQKFFSEEDIRYENKDQYKNQIDTLLMNLEEKEKNIALTIIKILFPNLGSIINQSVWYGSNILSYTSSSFIEKEKEKRICSVRRIRYYFTLDICEEDISDIEIRQILQNTKTTDDLISLFHNYNEKILDNGRSRLSYLLEKLWFYADEIKKANLVELFLESIYISANDYNNEKDNEFSFITTNNDIRLGRLLFSLYRVNSPDENYNYLLKIVENPLCISEASNKIAVLGQCLGHFSSSNEHNETYITEEQYQNIARTLIQTIKKNFTNIIDVKMAKEAIRFVKEFEPELAQSLLSQLVSTDNKFIDFLCSLYGTSYRTTFGGFHTKKETYISLKNISYWFDVNQVKERLEKISKNKKYKKTQQEMAAKILEDINYPRDENF